MIRLGLRIAEVSGLRFSDIDPDEKVIHVQRQFSQRGKVLDYAKTQAGRRRVPLTDDMLAKLQFRQSFYGLGDGDFVFAEKPGGNPPGHLNFRRRAWDAIVKKMGIELEEGVRLTPHDSRHMAASQLASLGLDEEDAASLLGHTSGRTARQIYTHSFDRQTKEERIRQAMERAANGS